MHSPDDKHYPLAKAKRTTQARRAVTKKDFTLPKPYRRQLFSEEPERLTRLQKGMLAFGAAMITTLVGVLALLANESDHSPEGKIIVEAARLETLEEAEAQLASYPAPPKPAETPIPPALARGPHTPALTKVTKSPVAARAQLAAKAKAKAKTKAKAMQATRLASAPKKPAQARTAPALLAREKRPNPAHKAPAMTAPVPDPDVALIAAILLLTPTPIPASSPPLSVELAGRAQASCAPAMPKDPTCTELLKLKP